jgi:Uncharacterized protein conserved in bacteria
MSEENVVVESEVVPSKEEKTLGLVCVLLQFLGFAVPFGSLIGPLVLWLVKKDSSHFLDEIGKETVNFQISMVIAAFICIILSFVFIGFLLLPIVLIYALVTIIIAAIKANEGTVYRYPVSIRFIK